MEMVSKAKQERFLHPIRVHSIIEKKENTGSQMGQIKKIMLNFATNSNLCLTLAICPSVNHLAQECITAVHKMLLKLTPRGNLIRQINDFSL